MKIEIMRDREIKRVNAHYDENIRKQLAIIIRATEMINGYVKDRHLDLLDIEKHYDEILKKGSHYRWP